MSKLQEIRNSIFDLAYDHETEKHITSQTASIMQAIEAYIAQQLQEYAEWTGDWPDEAKENVSLYLQERLDHLSKKGE